MEINNKWIDCKEEMPENCFIVIVAYKNGRVDTASYFRYKLKWINYEEEICPCAITHWQHLPIHPRDIK